MAMNSSLDSKEGDYLLGTIAVLRQSKSLQSFYSRFNGVKMDAQTLFLIGNYSVIPAWLLLMVAPKWIWTRKLIFHAWIPLLLGSVYIYCFIMARPAPEGGGFGSLDAVQILFAHPYTALAGWIHYLAFDLFVGAWEVRDAQRRGINHLWVVPCLLFTLMAGPAGLLLYLCIRFALTKIWGLDEASPAVA